MFPLVFCHWWLGGTREVAKKDCQAQELNKEDSVDRSR